MGWNVLNDPTFLLLRLEDARLQVGPPRRLWLHGPD
jgi:hypothetical protein